MPSSSSTTTSTSPTIYLDLALGDESTYTTSLAEYQNVVDWYEKNRQIYGFEEGKSVDELDEVGGELLKGCFEAENVRPSFSRFCLSILPLPFSFPLRCFSIVLTSVFGLMNISQHFYVILHCVTALVSPGVVTFFRYCDVARAYLFLRFIAVTYVPLTQMACDLVVYRLISVKFVNFCNSPVNHVPCNHPNH